MPTSGKVVVDGVDVLANPHEVRRRIGFLPDTPPLYGEMTVGSYLTFAARLRGVSAKDAPARVSEAEDKTALRDMHDELISSLSHGYRQRVGLAQAMVHRPALLILDEPTAGLDPVQIVEMRGLIRRLRGEHTLLISSHFLSEISQTCDRLLVIQAGEIVAQGTEQDLATTLGTAHEIEVTVRGNATRAQEAARGVMGVSRVEVLIDEGGEVAMRVTAMSDVRAQLARTLVLAGLDLLRFDRGATRLESIFIQLSRTRDRRGRRRQRRRKEAFVTPIWLILRRELGAYLHSMTGYIIVAAVLVVDGILFNAFALGGPEKLSGEVLALFFYFSSGTTMIASVFIAMRLFAEEKQTGTLVLLTSSPIKDHEIVLGKFLSGWAFLSIMTLLTAFMPALILVNGKVSLGHVVAGYVGLLLLGGATLAIGTLRIGAGPHPGAGGHHLRLPCRGAHHHVAAGQGDRTSDQPGVRVARPLPPPLSALPGGRDPPARRGLLPGHHLLRAVLRDACRGGSTMALKDSSPSCRPQVFRPALYPSFLYLLGMLAIFLGERVLDVGSMQTDLHGLAVS